MTNVIPLACTLYTAVSYVLRREKTFLKDDESQKQFLPKHYIFDNATDSIFTNEFRTEFSRGTCIVLIPGNLVSII